MPNQERVLNFNDTFLEIDHLKESFPEYEVKATTEDEERLERPFQLTFHDVKVRNDDEDSDEDDDEELDLPKKITVEPYFFTSRGPYVYDEPKKNAVRFTPTQTEAIRSGMQPGLTLVVGPPGEIIFLLSLQSK